MILMKTDVGRVRSSNQDTMISGELGNGARWAAVCDGMGGANGGNIASAECAKVLEEQIRKGYRENMSEESLRQLFETVLYNANTVVYGIAQENPDLQGMGTTVVLALIRGQKLYVAHIGDSRALLFRDGNLWRLTKDHTLVQSMIDAGELTEEKAMLHPNRHVITRAVGVMPTMQEEFGQWELNPEDWVLLCSDGLYNCVGEEEAAELMRQQSPSQWAENLVEQANQNGGEDNITVVLLRAGTNQEAE